MPRLSLPQAVLLFGYEWLKAESAALPLGRATEFDGPATEGIAFPDTRPATREELLGLFSHLEAELDRSGFLYPPEKRPSMVRAIRNMFHRMGATEQDVRTWRGIVASLSRKARAAAEKRCHSSAPFLLLRWPQTMISFRHGRRGAVDAKGVVSVGRCRRRAFGVADDGTPPSC